MKSNRTQTLALTTIKHTSSEQDESLPTPSGWRECRPDGVDPPPTLTPIGVLVPPGEEWQTLEHQLAQWFIDNDVVDLLLCHDTQCEDVVEKSLLLPFLCMAHPNKYTTQLVLQALHR
jgi:hypothetical protein